MCRAKYLVVVSRFRRVFCNPFKPQFYYLAVPSLQYSPSHYHIHFFYVLGPPQSISHPPQSWSPPFSETTIPTSTAAKPVLPMKKIKSSTDRHRSSNSSYRHRSRSHPRSSHSHSPDYARSSYAPSTTLVRYYGCTSSSIPHETVQRSFIKTFSDFK